MKLINIGFGNMVCANRLVAIVSPESAPIKRIIQDARDRGTLVDATYGRRTRAVIITDSDHVILSGGAARRRSPTAWWMRTTRSRTMSEGTLIKSIRGRRASARARSCGPILKATRRRCFRCR